MFSATAYLGLRCPVPGSPSPHQTSNLTVVLKRPIPWLVLAIALLVASVVGGFALFASGSPVARPARSDGSVVLLTGDPDLPVSAATTIDLALDQEANDDSDGPATYGEVPLSMNFTFDGDVGERIDWALLLSWDFALPTQGHPFEQLVNNDTEHPELPTLNAADEAELSATFVRDSGTLQVYPSNLIVGSLTLLDDNPRLADLAVDLPTNVTLVHDLGDSLALNLPTLGLPRETNWYGAPETIDIGDAARETLPSDVVTTIDESEWWYPEQSTWSLGVFPAVAEQRIEAAFPQQASLSNWSWSAPDSLEADVVIGIPSEDTARQNRLFLSGVVLGLAGGFLVWIFELIREASTHRRR